MDQNKPAETGSGFERFSEWRRTSLTLKLITIALLLLVLLIPLGMVQSIIYERQTRRDEAVQEVGQTWGGEQTVCGPVLTVPVKARIETTVPQTGLTQYSTITEYVHFFPEELKIDAQIDPQVRERGIYDILVYTGKIKMIGSFDILNFSEFSSIDSILWDKAFVSIGIPDLKAIRNTPKLVWNNQSLNVNPGAKENGVFVYGVSSDTPLEPNSTAKNVFTIDLELGGNSSLFFVPIGKVTDVHASSTWSSPKFIGSFLPNNKPQVDQSGFQADWKVLHLNRSYPQQFIGSMEGVNESAFGVQLMIRIDEYQRNERSAKYGILLIGLTFLTFFFIQVLNKVKIHFIQYLLVGFALSLFYLLLLSFSEQIGFNKAYLVAALATSGMVGLYFKSVTQSWKLTAIMLFLLSFVYIFTYVIIQLEDWSLLVGSIGLFIILALVMYLSRKVDWYALGDNRKTDIPL